MRKLVEEHLRKYIYQRTKNLRYLPYRELQLLQVPERVWSSVLLNFVVKLPPSKEPIIGTEFDFILVVVNRLIKWGTFISYKELFIAEDLVYIFL